MLNDFNTKVEHFAEVLNGDIVENLFKCECDRDFNWVARVDEFGDKVGSRSDGASSLQAALVDVSEFVEEIELMRFHISFGMVPQSVPQWPSNGMVSV